MGTWYRGGTASGTSGQYTVAGTLTVWNAVAKPGDAFVVGMDWYEIASVDGNTAITLTTAIVTTFAGAAYVIVPFSQRRTDVGTLAADVQDLLQSTAYVLIGSGAPSPTLGGSTAVYYDTTGSQIYIKTGGVWGSAQAFKGFTWRGAYSGATAYAINDVVSYQGATYVNILAGSGVAPPTWPTASNSRWQVYSGPGLSPGDVSYIPNVKGNIVAGNGSGFQALTVGANGRVLKADSSQATGLVWATARDYATGTLNLYVNTATGNDANDGLSAGSAVKTIGKAWDLVAGRDLGIYSCIVNVADGTYAEALTFDTSPVGGKTVSIKGNSTTPGNVVLAPASGACVNIAAIQSATVKFDGVKFVSSGSSILTLSAPATVQLTNIEFGAASTYVINATGGGAYVSFIGGTYAITGSASRFFSSVDGAKIRAVNGSFAMPSALAFTTFCHVERGGMVICNGAAFTGAGIAGTTGKRYNTDTSGVIYTNGGGANFFPGSTAGTTTAVDQYV